MQGGAHPLAAFSHGLIRQADQRQGRHAVADLHLNVDLQNLDSLEGHGFNAGYHPKHYA